MKVFQVLPSGAMDDIVREDAVALSKLLRDMGMQTGIYTDRPDHMQSKWGVRPMRALPRLSGEDVLIYHKCPDMVLRHDLQQYTCRKLLRFHGCIPPRDWKPYHPVRADEAEQSMRELCVLADEMDYCITDTAFQKTVLETLHYRGKMASCPPFMTFSEYTKTPAPEVITRYAEDGVQNFLSVGTLAPYQKAEDVIRIFACYQRNCSTQTRLFLMGDMNTARSYVKRLQRYVQGLELASQVVFTGSVSTEEQLAYFQLADFCVDMSEHTGFSPSLIQAMYFGVPILASDTPEHRDVMGDGGLLTTTAKETQFPMEAALLMYRILQERNLYREVVAEQRRRQQDFSYHTLRKQMETLLRDFLETVPAKSKRLHTRR